MMQHKALFLDRDGVINYDHGYVSTIKRFDFFEGIFDLCQHAIRQGYHIIVITNQSGIARGFYTLAEFLQLNQWMISQFKEAGIDITDTYYCPHLPTGTIPEFTTACDCRKPAPGMFLKAAQDHDIDLGKSIMIGDKNDDMIAASKAAVGTKILLSNIPSTEADYNVTSHKEIIKLLFS